MLGERKGFEGVGRGEEVTEIVGCEGETVGGPTEIELEEAPPVVIEACPETFDDSVVTTGMSIIKGRGSLTIQPGEVANSWVEGLAKGMSGGDGWEEGKSAGGGWFGATLEDTASLAGPDRVVWFWPRRGKITAFSVTGAGGAEFWFEMAEEIGLVAGWGPERLVMSAGCWSLSLESG